MRGELLLGLDQDFFLGLSVLSDKGRLVCRSCKVVQLNGLILLNSKAGGLYKTCGVWDWFRSGRSSSSSRSRRGRSGAGCLGGHVEF